MESQDEEVFVALVEELQDKVHNTAKEKGWWDNPDRNFGETIALMHSELSEALEAMRHGNPPSDHIPEFSGVEEELADVFIRMLDVCGWYKFDFVGALLAKMEFNKARPHKHGGKLF